MKKNLVLFMAALSLITACAPGGSAESSSTVEAESKKVITVGCDATTPGWTQTEASGELSGFEIDMWKEIGSRIGYEVEFTVMEWDALWTMFDDNRLDTIANQVAITEARSEKYDFTSPYAYNYYAVLAAKENEALNSFDDLKSGMKFSAETNSTDEIIMQHLNEKYNIELEPVFYDGMSVQDVILGRCDLWPRAESSALITIKEMPELKILGVTEVLETNAYPFTRTDRGKELKELVDKTLGEMQADGTIKKLSEKWFEIDLSQQK